MLSAGRRQALEALEALDGSKRALAVVVLARPKLPRWARPRGCLPSVLDCPRCAFDKCRPEHCSQLRPADWQRWWGRRVSAAHIRSSPAWNQPTCAPTKRGIMDHRRISPCLVSVLCAGRHLRSSIKRRPSLDSQQHEHDALPRSPEFDRQSEPGVGILESLAPSLASLDAMHLCRIFNTHLFQTHCSVAP